MSFLFLKLYILQRLEKKEEWEISKNDPRIAAAVVRGIEISGGNETVDGEKVVIPPMTDDEWYKLVRMKEIVFARTSPENKLDIVQQFKKAGNITGAVISDDVHIFYECLLPYSHACQPVDNYMPISLQR